MDRVFVAEDPDLPTVGGYPFEPFHPPMNGK